MGNLEKIIQSRTSANIAFAKEINSVLAKEWMGNTEKEDSPLYNIKKNYGYDINRNSGFNKKWWETIRDSIVDKTAEWTVGGIIGTVMLLLGNFLAVIYNLR